MVNCKKLNDFSSMELLQERRCKIFLFLQFFKYYIGFGIISTRFFNQLTIKH
jgi:hypothetical protein